MSNSTIVAKIWSSFTKALRPELHWRVGLKLAFILALVFATRHVAQGADDAQSELTEPGKAFKEYQYEAPPIKHIVYEQSYTSGKYGPGVMWADGAIEPGGFFVRQLTNSPYTTNILVDGASLKDEWEYFPENMNTCYGPRTFWTNYSESMVFPGFEDLQTVVFLGLPRPFPDHDGFIWTSQTEFRFHNPWDDFLGRITKFDDSGRPVELEYHSAKKNSPNWRKCTISYEYDSVRKFPPSRFVQNIENRDSHWATTNILHTLEIGSNNHAENGYFAREFIPPDARINDVFYISNHCCPVKFFMTTIAAL